MVATLVGSYEYLGLTQSTMADDFWSEGFNASGHQTFLATRFNNQLQTTNRALLLDRLDNLIHSDLSQDYASTGTTVLVAPLYASAIQVEVNTLSAVVQGLRTMDSCLLPWIASSYCYVDFNRTWGMAGTTARQEACHLERSNGAVYLDAILRNANEWARLMQCWGTSFDGAIFAPLFQSTRGVA
ncbi:Aste57867_8703 [Aphanomyces stellatus]|uniref:Aste57867_8703 protein n=1 Tax=Aphanomyces stellatus TaxID=120398 RepID=A0A485KL61_9STRA|nr:hypothetical protein As57867_008669 [Aphanomyces stellatus]VFT85589.1 Aste57867_8703 [Aphanomyces stellatus]